MALSDFVVESTNGGGWRIAISRDGGTIVAGGADDLLYVRRSDDTEFRPIPGTMGAQHPTISPDGEWLAFALNGGLSKVLLVGGPVLSVTSSGRNPHWYVQEEIIYSMDEGVGVVSAAGGEGTVVPEGDMGRPFMLPGGRAFLYGAEGGVVPIQLGNP